MPWGSKRLLYQFLDIIDIRVHSIFPLFQIRKAFAALSIIQLSNIEFENRSVNFLVPDLANR